MEQPILDIQQRLSDLRQDRSRFFTVVDVKALYTEFKGHIDTLSAAQLTQMRLVICDCLLIFSLAFNTVGFTREPVAVYAKAVSLTRLFEFIRWDPAFTPKELNMLNASVQSIRGSLSLAYETEIPVIDYVNEEISRLAGELEERCECAKGIIDTLPDEEYPIYSQITHMRRYILAQLISDSKDGLHAALRAKLERVAAHVHECFETDEGHQPDESDVAAALKTCHLPEDSCSSSSFNAAASSGSNGIDSDHANARVASTSAAATPAGSRQSAKSPATEARATTPASVHSGQGAAAGASSPLLRHQIHKAFLLVDKFDRGVDLDEMDAEDPALRPLYDKLKAMLPILDVFVMTRRWTLRVTDLYQQMKTLLRIFPHLIIAQGAPDYQPGCATPDPVAPKQKYRYLLTYLARRSCALIFKLLDTVEPVSESLHALYNQLVTMKRCLREVSDAGGISNLRELYPYQLKLASLDQQRVDGKFVVGGEVPPGQGMLNALLAECFDMAYELKVELEERGGDEFDSNTVDADSSSDECEVDDADRCLTLDGSDGDEASTSDVLTKVPSRHLDDGSDHLADVPEAKE